MIGASKKQHLTDAVSALQLHLTQEEKDLIEKPYRPRQIKGHV